MLYLFLHFKNILHSLITFSLVADVQNACFHISAQNILKLCVVIYV